ncbi:MAG TPA: pantoate--beta-alanine ligase [Puia sp.]|jgi:pantoate--beta-alanine ligase|nr:pantoate--beta-alanine ligase [Puia sp.]
MILFKRSVDLQQWVSEQKNKSEITGFVPTMGALHEGHMQLIRASRSMVGQTICSIFVNPVQFNDPKDFEKYPVSIEKDLQMLHHEGTDVVFLPSVQDIYPHGQTGLETYDLGPLETLLEGRYRPGHFQGVSQVMSRLLKIVQPDHLFMGQKDYQQCLVVQRLIGIMHLPVQFHSVPTVREADGLAQSSRNRRLTAEQRKNAVAISQALNDLRGKLPNGDAGELLKEAHEKLDAAHFKTDYITIARASDLEPITHWNGQEKAVALIAAFQGDVRLIDNMLLN